MIDIEGLRRMIAIALTKQVEAAEAGDWSAAAQYAVILDGLYDLLTEHLAHKLGPQ